jgi:hypothetical protein
VRAGASRLRAAGGALDHDQRFAAGAALALLLAMFLPWYEKSVVVAGSKAFAKDTISAFGAVSFVEAAIFLVSAGVLVLVLARAEGGKFHLPGGDGTIILAAGLWATALIFYRVFDRPNVSGEGGTVGIQWGFFVAFAAAGVLAYAGQRMRAAARPATPVRESRSSRRADDDSTEVVSWSDAPTSVVRADPPPMRSNTPPDAEVVEPAAAARADAPAGEPSPRDRLDAPAGEPRPRDRAVRREDARVSVDDPPDAPLRPAGDGPTARDRD